MSSVTMAADSTQADFTQRVKPVMKTMMRGEGRREGRGHHFKRDRSRSRHRSSSRSCRKQKQRSNYFQSKTRRQYDDYDDSSDRDSDLDLSKDLLPISGYIGMKDEMVLHMFHSISNRKLRAMLPEILKPVSVDELKKLCVEQLEVMSKKRICCILDGADPETISSSGTEDEEDCSRLSTDGEEGPEEERASTEIDGIDSTSVHAADNQMKIGAGHLADDSCAVGVDVLGNNDKDLETRFTENKDCRLTDKEGRQVKDCSNGEGKNQMELDDATMIIAEGMAGGSSRMPAITFRETGIDEDCRFNIKVSDGKYRNEDNMGNIVDDAGNMFGREGNIKMTKRTSERTYRTKQLDEDERDAESDVGRGRGGRNEESRLEASGDDVVKSKCVPRRDQLTKEEKDLSESESIPQSLPDLVSEPEETCAVAVLETESARNEMAKDGLRLPCKLNSEKCGATADVKQQSQNIYVRASDVQTKKYWSPIRASETHGGQDRREYKSESVNENSQYALRDKSANGAGKTKLTTSYVESVNEAEEMIIEIQDYEFSDNDDDDHGDVKKRDKNKNTDGEKNEIKDLHCETVMQEGVDNFESDVRGKSSDCRMTLLAEDNDISGEDGAESSLHGNTEIAVKYNVCESTLTTDEQVLRRKNREDNDDVVSIQAKLQKLAKLSSGPCKTLALKSESKNSPKIMRSGVSEGKDIEMLKDEVQAGSSTRLGKKTSLCKLESVETVQVISFDRDNQTQQSVSSVEKRSCDRTVTINLPKTANVASSEETSIRRVTIKDFCNVMSSDVATKNDKTEMTISSSRIEESSRDMEGEGQKMSSVDSMSEAENETTPALSKTQLEILELEMRARAIKAMLKAQEDLEKREEGLRLEEKHPVPSASQQARSSRSGECHKVVRLETKTIRVGSSSKEMQREGVNKELNSTRRVIPRDIHRRAAEQRAPERHQLPCNSQLREECSTQRYRNARARPPIRLHSREVTTAPTYFSSATRLVKRPFGMMRGRGGGGQGSGFGNAARVVRLSSGGTRANDSRLVVTRPKAIASTGQQQSVNVQDRPWKPFGNKDVRRVVTSSSSSSSSHYSRAVKGAGGSVRYGHRAGEFGSLPARDFDGGHRPNVAWQRRVNYK